MIDDEAFLDKSQLSFDEISDQHLTGFGDCHIWGKVSFLFLLSNTSMNFNSSQFQIFQNLNLHKIGDHVHRANQLLSH